MERKEAIRSAYRLTGGNNFYDGMITCSTLSGKAVCRLVWDMNSTHAKSCLCLRNIRHFLCFQIHLRASAGPRLSRGA